MKEKFLKRLAFCLCLSIAAARTAFAQGTAFTYQGQLQNGGNPANGSYDFIFSLYPGVAGGGSVAGPITNLAVGVTNGLFTTTINFGSNVFNGQTNWLDISVRTNGSGVFAELSPRQPLLPAPYAVFSGTAGTLSGTLSAAQLTGTLSNSTLPANPIFSGTISANSLTANNASLGNALITNSVFSGNGAALTNINITNVMNGQNIANVKSFGAYGDNFHDDTAAIQAAENYCKTHPSSLYFPAGTYLISAEIDFDPYTGLEPNIQYRSSSDVFGDGPALSIIKQTSLTANGFVFTNIVSTPALTWRNFALVGPLNAGNVNSVSGTGLLAVHGVGDNFSSIRNVFFYQWAVGANVFFEDVLWYSCDFEDNIIGLWESNTGDGNNNDSILNCMVTGGFYSGAISASGQQQIGYRIDRGNGHVIINNSMNIASNGIAFQFRGCDGFLTGTHMETVYSSLGVDMRTGGNSWTMSANFGQNSGAGTTNSYPIIVGQESALTLVGDNGFIGWSSGAQIKRYNTPSSLVSWTGVGLLGGAWNSPIDVYNTDETFLTRYIATPFNTIPGANPFPASSTYNGSMVVTVPAGTNSSGVWFGAADGKGNFFQDNLDQYNIDVRNGSAPAISGSNILAGSIQPSALASPVPTINQGSVTLTNASSFTVIFATPFADTNYWASQTGNGIALNGAYVSAKTVSNCVFNLAPASGVIDWIAVHK